MSSVNNVFSKACSCIRANQSTILTLLGVAGLVATSVVTVKATTKASRILKEASDEKGEELTTTEIVKVAAPSFIPVILVGASTIACILGANVLNKRKQASLASAYALLSQSYNKYRQSAKSVFGEDADEKIHADMAKKAYISADGMGLIDPDGPNGENVLFYDSISDKYFTSNMTSVINGIYHVNRNLQLRGDVCLDEYHDFLGINHISAGDELGWRMDDIMELGLMWLDFDIRKIIMDDGMECYTIYAAIEPSLLEPE